jgi:uncharacterized hydantoinase/oxoprolinase family protein
MKLLAKKTRAAKTTKAQQGLVNTTVEIIRKRLKLKKSAVKLLRNIADEYFVDTLNRNDFRTRKEFEREVETAYKSKVIQPQKSTLKEILEPYVIPIADKVIREHQFLDRLVDETPLNDASAMYGLLKIATSGKRPELIKEAMDRLYARIEPIIQGKRDKLDAESEIVPVLEMTVFLNGLKL